MFVKPRKRGDRGIEAGANSSSSSSSLLSSIRAGLKPASQKTRGRRPWRRNGSPPQSHRGCPQKPSVTSATVQAIHSAPCAVSALVADPGYHACSCPRAPGPPESKEQSAKASAAPHQCALTLRSSGAPTAKCQARSGGTRYIFASPGLAFSCRRPLSSNVRHQNNRNVQFQQEVRLAAWIEQPRGGQAASLARRRRPAPSHGHDGWKEADQTA